MIPIPKSSKEYHPISILSYLSNSFEPIIHYGISTYINMKHLLPSRQSGFRTKHCCITALIGVADDIRSIIEHSLVSDSVLLDHSMAFDSNFL